MIRVDIVIRGGTVIDPARGLAGQGDVLIRDGKIIDLAAGEEAQAEESIDAAGCLVTPGLIDNHAHVFYGGSAPGLQPEATLLPMGVTTVVDAGSTGVDTTEAFIRSTVQQSRMRIFCSLNVSSEGQITRLHREDLNPESYDRGRLAYFLAKYPNIVKGLKIRCGTEVLGQFGLSALTGALELADSLGCSLTVHTANPPCDMGDLALMLRPGDVFCHCFHGTGNTIINANGRVKEKIRRARGKGVLFDTADARGNHSNAVTRAALADDFRPDIISSDLVGTSVFRGMGLGMPVLMSKYLAFGVPLLDVVRACTVAPAATLGLAGKIGTLAPGAMADVAIFALRKKERRLRNLLDETMVLPQQVVPQMTILDGRIVFRQVDFC